MFMNLYTSLCALYITAAGMIRWRCKSFKLSGYPKDMQKPKH